MIHETKQETFNTLSFAISKLEKVFYYGFSIYEKNNNIIDQSCRNDLIKILEDKKEYPNVQYCEDFQKVGYILLDECFSLKYGEGIDLYEFTTEFSKWARKCEENKEKLDLVRRRFFIPQTNSVNNIEVKMYCIF